MCPHCGNIGAWKIEGARAGLYKCSAYKCGEQFTVTVKSVFENSKVSLTKWLTAVHLLCASNQRISSRELSRVLNVTYKTAWFMSHRIRHAMIAEGGGLTEHLRHSQVDFPHNFRQAAGYADRSGIVGKR
jgi:transposase-like protein